MVFQERNVTVWRQPDGCQRPVPTPSRRLSRRLSPSREGRETAAVTDDTVAADTLAVVDPATYETGPPLEALARLRDSGPVVWVDEPALHGLPAGPGFWLVLRHAGVEGVLRDPATFSSWLGATQVRDSADLEWVRRMMLNTDPPDHSPLRRMLSRSFTPRAVAALAASIEATAAGLVDRMTAGWTDGRCDFARDVAAELPLVTLAEVLGVPAKDRWLLFDWSNRVIGWQDPDYASSAAFDGSGGTAMARQAVALRPARTPRAGCPTRAPATACRTSTPTPGCWPRRSAGPPVRT